MAGLQTFRDEELHRPRAASGARLARPAPTTV
jgi:hypothetical protein